MTRDAREFHVILNSISFGLHFPLCFLRSCSTVEGWNFGALASYKSAMLPTHTSRPLNMWTGNAIGLQYVLADSGHFPRILYISSRYLVSVRCSSFLHCVLFTVVASKMAFQKVALITAGTAGLGAQIARALAPDFRVVCYTSQDIV